MAQTATPVGLGAAVCPGCHPRGEMELRAGSRCRSGSTSPGQGRTKQGMPRKDMKLPHAHTPQISRTPPQHGCFQTLWDGMRAWIEGGRRGDGWSLCQLFHQKWDLLLAVGVPAQSPKCPFYFRGNFQSLGIREIRLLTPLLVACRSCFSFLLPT